MACCVERLDKSIFGGHLSFGGLFQLCDLCGVGEKRSPDDDNKAGQPRPTREGDHECDVGMNC